jgi:hypothetical protein
LRRQNLQTVKRLASPCLPVCSQLPTRSSSDAANCCGA